MKRVLFLFISIFVLTAALSSFYYYVIFLPNKENTNNIEQTLSASPAIQPTSKPGIDQGVIRTSCINEVKGYLEKNKDLKITETGLRAVNTVYRMCLAKNGMAPEDLVSNIASQNEEGTYQPPQIIDSGESSWDKYERENREKCQEDINKYNICMNEYNIKLGEYNSCLSESNNPNSWRYKAYCYKPSNFCYKPLCAY